MSWRPATVASARPESPAARTVVLQVPGWPGHQAGQHVDIRVTAEDGYTASRSYSIASVADGELVEVTVERLDDGEVSPYLVDVVAPGDRLEVRGPVGGWFVWKPDQVEPVLLVGGGSGVVPLMSIVRRHVGSGSSAPRARSSPTSLPTTGGAPTDNAVGSAVSASARNRVIAGFLDVASTASASTPAGKSGTAAVTAAMIRDRRHAVLHRRPRQA